MPSAGTGHGQSTERLLLVVFSVRLSESLHHHRLNPTGICRQFRVVRKELFKVLDALGPDVCQGPGNEPFRLPRRLAR